MANPPVDERSGAALTAPLPGREVYGAGSGTRDVIGWDIGGAHVKACLVQDGEVIDVAQWACPLWQGLAHLEAAFDAARSRWPAMRSAQHAVTMTGEMVDLFVDREDGVRRIALEARQALGRVAFFVADAGGRGATDVSGWCDAADVPGCWAAIASANWLATARHAALRMQETGQETGQSVGVLVDIGSTTTDLIAFRAGRVLAGGRSDAQRLASDELVYHGVVRTPLCALAQRIDWRGTPHHVMNEWFATTADVYRATGELDPAHDLQPSADQAAKDLPATYQRLARMVGLDARDGSADDWFDIAREWRSAQVGVLGDALRRVFETHALGPQAVVVSAGCGDFLVADVLAHAQGGASAASAASTASQRRVFAYGNDVARVAARAATGTAAWAQVCAPSVAVATLFDKDHR